MIKIDELMLWLNQTLEPSQFNDYCPNGLQVEGRDEIQHIVTGVTASLALIEAARDLQADAILVHHGWFWRNEDPTIRGNRYQRIRTLIQAELNLIAYHLPLDAHPQYGNNAQLGQRLGLNPLLNALEQPDTLGASNLIWQGYADQTELTVRELVSRIETRLKRAPVWVGDSEQGVGKVAWCTGGAQGMFEAAIEGGAQTYITGEISEPNAHLAREYGVTYIAAGHHATERYGILALGQAVEENLDVQVTFVDIDNPA